VVLSRPYAEECVGGIETSTSFLLLASESAISSVQVLSEVEQAHKRRKPIYTILIGKPKVSKELDYYISRLHWIEYAGTSVERLVGQLVKVLSGGQSWSDIASPPSLRRTVLYRRDAFAGSAVATLLAIVLAGAGLAYWRHQQQTRLDLDYRRLGYVALLSVDSSATAVDPQGANVQAQVFLLAHGVPFRDIAFITSVHRSDGGIDQSDRSNLFNPEQVGSVEVIGFQLPMRANKLTTCLIVPSPGLHARYRVTQLFSQSTTSGSPANDPAVFMPTAEPRVSKEDGTPCGSAH